MGKGYGIGPPDASDAQPMSVQCDSGNRGPASCFMKKSWPGIVGIHVDGSQGVGGWPSVMQSEHDCHDAPRSG
jgi:hypothetical protein